MVKLNILESLEQTSRAVKGYVDDAKEDCKKETDGLKEDIDEISKEVMTYDSVLPTTWEKGAINTDDGGVFDSSTRIRSGYIPVKVGDKIWVDDGYKFLVAGYTAQGVGYYVGKVRSYTDTGAYIADRNFYIRIAMATVTDATLSDTSISEHIHCIINKKSRIDDIESAVEKSASDINAISALIDPKKGKYIKHGIANNFYSRNWYDGTSLTVNEFNQSTTVAQFYEKMNALVDSYSWRMSKYNLGKDASGQYDIWGYRFFPYDAPPKAISRPRIIIISGQHGFERGSAFELYNLMWLFRNKFNDTGIKDLVSSCEICFIPIVNPWGFDHYTPTLTDAQTIGRENSNGVDLNRGYHGTNLQAEQTIVKNFVDRWKDNAVLFIDHHVNGSTRYEAPSASSKTWISVEAYDSMPYIRKMASEFVDYMSANRASYFGGTQLCCTTNYGTDISPAYSTIVGDDLNLFALTYESSFKMSTSKDALATEEEFTAETNKYNTVNFVNFLIHSMVFLRDFMEG